LTKRNGGSILDDAFRGEEKEESVSTSRTGWLPLAGFGILGVAAFLGTAVQATPASPVQVNPQPLPPEFVSGLVALTSGQHVRVSVVSLLPMPAPGEPPQNPAVALIELFSEIGEELSKRQDQIPDGGSTFLDKSFEDLTSSLPPGTAPTRLEIRAVAAGVVGATKRHAPFRVSLEIYDADTGKTRIGHEVVIAFEEGDPDQPIVLGTVFNAPVRFRPGLIGLASGQHARLSVASLLPKPLPGTPGDPTAVELTFFTDQGTVVATAEVQVGVGESKFLEIAFQDVLNAQPPGLIPPGPTQTRLEIRAAARGIPNPLTPGGARLHPPQPCIPSLEIFDVDTGKTTVALLPAVQ
jgi:hypothetical protein